VAKVEPLECGSALSPHSSGKGEGGREKPRRRTVRRAEVAMAGGDDGLYTDLVTALNKLDGHDLFGLLVAHELGHPKVARPNVLHEFIALHGHASALPEYT